MKISKEIGILTEDSHFKNWWKSSEIEIPFFNNKKLAITFMDYEPELDLEFIGEADESFVNFLKLNEEYRNSISGLVYENCMDFLDNIGSDELDQPLRDIQNQNEIWNFVRPTEIFIERRPCNDKDIYLIISCKCDWEQEHGLQLVFRHGKQITRVSSHDGFITESDATNSDDSEDLLLSQFTQ